jgi:hypothetical protein
MTLRIRIAALGLLFGATVPAVYAEESRPISSLLRLLWGSHHPLGYPRAGGEAARHSASSTASSC